MATGEKGTEHSPSARSSASSPLAHPAARRAPVTTEQQAASDTSDASFESFFEANQGRLFGSLCLITGNRQEAEELMQDAFLKVWERWERVQALADPTGYLFQTAMNGFRKRYRRAALGLRRSLGVAPVEDAFDAAETRHVVLAALRRLGSKQRAAIVLTGLLDFSSEEAGRMLGVSPSTVRVLTTRARATLRNTMEEGR